jgi:hypothetical protein
VEAKAAEAAAEAAEAAELAEAELAEAAAEAAEAAELAEAEAAEAAYEAAEAAELQQRQAQQLFEAESRRLRERVTELEAALAAAGGGGAGGGERPWFTCTRQEPWQLAPALCAELAWAIPEPDCGYSTAGLGAGGGGGGVSGRLLEQVRALFAAGGAGGRPVAGYGMTRAELVRNEELERGFRSMVQQRSRRREEAGSVFNAQLVMDPEKMAALARLKQLFLPSDIGLANVALVWHGCTLATAASICRYGAADLRRNDGGYFGSGPYLTPQAGYAAQYATGELTGAAAEPNAAGEFVMLLCVVVLGNVYPLSRQADYDRPGDFGRRSVSKFHCAHPVPAVQVLSLRARSLHHSLRAPGAGDLHHSLQVGPGDDLAKRDDKALKAPFDGHFVDISVNRGYQAAPLGEAIDYDELVVKEDAQVLPLCKVYFKRAA